MATVGIMSATKPVFTAKEGSRISHVRTSYKIQISDLTTRFHNDPIQSTTQSVPTVYIIWRFKSSKISPQERIACSNLACENEKLSPRGMRACNDHGGKSINARLISIHIIYKPNKSFFRKSWRKPLMAHTKWNPKM